MTAMCGMISWTGILWTSIRWNKGLKAQGIDRKTLPYMAPLQPYLSYYGISMCIMVIIFGGFGSFMPTFDASSFVTTYFPIPFFAVLFFGYKFWTKPMVVDYADMDFVTGSSSDVIEKETTQNLWQKISDRI
ncbi:hypothetical protein N7463_010682 [Penicillium fimorum]|uniref:Amino acid permease/ SLC12A domain-containing protein n=1 Tax=Penicillium fimorum TaxID=1882269 RepID=A0A9W9XL58_9EURO|nr:hypothetical protein N7463_010682 [Penicillium fimorum]